MVKIVCVNWGNYEGRGALYVNNLYAAVKDQPGVDSFVCFTDNSRGLHPGIEARPLPEGVIGWWNKLYLFKEGLFDKGERIIFLDLDTIITGDITDLLSYKGQFAILKDFNWAVGPVFQRYAPGMMMWEAGFGHDIWETYEAAGYPTTLRLGDMDWINNIFGQQNYKPDLIQELFPGRVVSYKVHARDKIPEEASVVCFHGKPRPHQACGWVQEYWKAT